MGLQEHLTEKISNALLDLGLSDEVIDSFEAYMEDSLEEEEFFKCLPDIDMNSLQDEVVEQLVSTYKSLERRKVEGHIEKYIRILFKIGERSTFSIIEKLHYVYYRGDMCRKLLKYKVKPAFVISYYAEHIVSSENNLSITFINFFDGIYKKYESEEVTVYDLTFYKKGTVKRGSYVYDTVKEQHIIKTIRSTK